MKKFFTICLLSIFSIALSGCGEEKNSDDSSSDANIEITEQKFFLESLPADWAVLSENTYKDSVVFAAEEPSQMEDIDTLIVVTQYNSIPNSLENFSRKSLENIRKISQDYSLLWKENLTLQSGEKAIYIVFSDRTGLGLPVEYMTLMTLTPKKSQSSILTIRIDPSTSDSHKKFLKDILLSYNPYGKSTR